MSDPIQFSFSRNRLILLAACVFVVGCCLVAAGLSAGLLLNERSENRAVNLGRSTAKAANLPQTPSTAPGAMAGADASAEAAPQPLETETVPNAERGVMIDVASFSQKGKAADLARMLKREGFAPVHAGSYQAQGEVLYYVQVGPLQDWEEASRTAAKLDESFDLHTSVLPARSAP